MEASSGIADTEAAKRAIDEIFMLICSDFKDRKGFLEVVKMISEGKC